MIKSWIREFIRWATAQDDEPLPKQSEVDADEYVKRFGH